MKFNIDDSKKMAGIFLTTLVAVLCIVPAAQPANADGFMEYETERQRITEANGECEINGAFGVDKQACVSAYYCSNWNICEGENMRPIEPTPSGSVYRDTQGGDE
jgi:hypothetical protein